MEDTVAADVDGPHVDKSHKYYDHRAQSMLVGKKFGGMNEYATTMRRRANTELACTRTRFIEPFGDQREDFYEQRLLLGLPWYCTHDPQLVSGASGTPTSDTVSIVFLSAMLMRQIHQSSCDPT